MVTEQVVSVWLILIGPALGSFVTAISDRHCAGRAVLVGRSRCADCGVPIRAVDLLPLLSWLMLRGRCRACNGAIPRRLWLGEFAGLGCGIVAVLAGDSTVERIFATLFFVVLLGLFQADRLCFRLPDVLTWPLLMVGLALGWLNAPLPIVLLAAVTGASALWLIGAFYFAMRGRVGMGLGDVKMMAGISAAVGLPAIAWVTLVAAVLALSFALLQSRRLDPMQPVPFGCYLAIAAALVWLWPAVMG